MTAGPCLGHGLGEDEEDSRADRPTHADHSEVEYREGTFELSAGARSHLCLDDGCGDIRIVWSRRHPASKQFPRQRTHD